MSLRTAQPPLALSPVAHAVEIGPAAGLVEDAEGGRVFLYGVLALLGMLGIRRCGVYPQSSWSGLRLLGPVKSLPGSGSMRQRCSGGVSKPTITVLVPWRRVSVARKVRPGSVMKSLLSSRLGKTGVLCCVRSVLNWICRLLRSGLDCRPQTAVDSGAWHHHGTGYAHPGGAQADQAPSESGNGGDVEYLDAAGEESVPAAEHQGPGLLAAAAPRAGERALTRAGMLGEAAPMFTPTARVPAAGLLLGVPGIQTTDLLQCASEIYGRLPQGFYGLSTVLLEAVFRILADRSLAEGNRRIDPVA